MINQVEIFDSSRIPYEGSPTFRADASYVWGQINPVLLSMNTSITQMNTSFDMINGYYNATKTYNEQSYGYRNECLTYRNDALSAKEAIEGYVVPTEATLNPDEIKALVDNHRLDDFLGFNF